MAGPLSSATAEFGRRVRARREALGYSQEGFAHVAGIDRSYVGQLERGEKNTTLHTMLSVAHSLDIDLGELTTGLELPETASE